MLKEEHGNNQEMANVYNLNVQSKFFLGGVEMELKTKKVKNAVGETITIQYIGPVDNNN